MANPSPFKARQAKRRARKPGDLLAVQQLLWTALREAEEVLLTATETDLTLKAVHAISQASGQYVRLLEVAEYEPRIAALEEMVKRYAETHG